MLGAAIVSKRTAKNVLTLRRANTARPTRTESEISCDDDDRR